MIIINEIPQISLKYLKSEGLFDGWQPISIESNSMKFDVELIDYDLADCRIRITWDAKGKTYRQFIPLVRVETNLGLGYFRWSFSDLDRTMRFEKIYYNGYGFVRRVDLKDAFYSDQLKTKVERAFDQLYIMPLMLIDEIERNLKNPYQKSHYRGKLTKRMLRMEKQKSKLDKSQILREVSP